MQNNNNFFYEFKEFPKQCELILEQEKRFIICPVKPDETNKIQWLVNHGFYFLDRRLDVRVLITGRKESIVNKRRYDTYIGQLSLDELRGIFHEAYTADRRFHLTIEYDQQLANQVIDLYIECALRTGMRLVVCSYQGKAIGCAFLEQIEEGYHIYLAAIKPRYQRAGAAIEMYEAAIDYCRDQQGKAVTGQISASNTAVMNLYAKLGASFYQPLDYYVLDRGNIENDV